ncbi:ParB/RepB/Spo0J family partition protein [Indioceanicola profundi]|uniref:ParB/RepB/Spo0J family partition protein n=1 Tax=Indioceanicola profundi TaxID=2220096 RepID=UPI000E6A963A|nr:ParB/RepB/Spo0J family partition protein [Indioceanicola profundi]
MKLKRRETFGTAIDRVAKDPLFGTSADFPRLLELDVGQLQPRADQPRRHFDPSALEELAASMARVRLIHPILVREREDAPGVFEIVSGERRWRAAQMLGWSTIFAIVTTGDVDEIALIENLQRQDLNALEEANGLQRLLDKHGYTQEELGAAVGKSQGQVSALLRLRTLHPTIQTEYPTSDKQVARSLLIELATIDDPDRQLALWQRAKDGTLTVRALRQEKAGHAIPTPSVPREKGGAKVLISGLDRVVKELERVKSAQGTLDTSSRSQLRDMAARISTLLDEI